MKKMLSILLATVMVVSMFAGLQISSSALEPTGQCGDNVYWLFNSSTDTLTISGNGDMTDYYYRDESPFYRQSDINIIIINSGVTSIGESAFSGCTRLTNITIPEGVTSIGASAFWMCDNLTTISMPNSVTSIGEYSFYGCEKLESVKLSESLKTISNHAFYSTKINNLYIPATVEQIGYKALSFIGEPYQIESLSDAFSVSFPKNSNVKMIGGKSNVRYDYNLKQEVYYSDYQSCINYHNERNGSDIKEFYVGPYLMAVDQSVTGTYKVKEGTIGIAAWAFCNCNKITNIELPNSLKYISYGTFSYCTGLKSITLPKSVDVIFEGPFNNCSNLKEIIVMNPLCKLNGDSIDGGWATFTYGIKKVTLKGYVDSTVYSWYKNCLSDDADFAFEKIGTYHCSHVFTYNTIAPLASELGFTLSNCSLCDCLIKNDFTAPTGKQTLKCKAKTAISETVQWNNVKTATGYQVQISTKDGKKWDKYYTLKAGTTAYTFKNLAAGNAYKFRVRFYITAPDGKNYFSPWSSTLTSPTLPSGTTLTKLTPAKKAFTAQWKKNAAVTGYQVQYSLKSNFSGAKTITVKSPKTLKAVASKLYAGKYYYVRIRTYKTISKVNYFSTWSKTYKVKTK